MPRIKWLFPLLLLLLCPYARANTPLILHRGSCAAQNSFVATINCAVNNVTAGNTIILDFQYAGTGQTLTTTETFTCPANSTNSANIGGFDYRAKKCYVVLASNHTTFSIQITVSGGAANIYIVNAREIQGLGAVDSSSAANAANTLSLSVTTAASGEWIDGFCVDYSHYLTTAGSSLQEQNSQANPMDVTNRRGLSEYQIAGAASSYTVSCTSNTTGNIQQIVGLAFAVSSPPARPTVPIIQECVGDTGNSGSVEQECPLSNVVSGNTILVGYAARGAAPAVACTEACTCPAGAATSQTYGGQTYFIGSCYVFLASSHSTFSARLNNSGGVSWILATYEVSGLTSFDSGSPCASASTSCTYTTATANEWSWMFAADTQANPMVAGNSFEPIGFTTNQVSTVNQALMGAKITVSSGSNTASYTETGSTTPLISSLSFGPSPVALFRNAQIF